MSYCPATTESHRWTSVGTEVQSGRLVNIRECRHCGAETTRPAK